ncbi:hypothetical protein ACFQIC_10740 [Halobacillus seohaensis]|uniref:O-antigen ligase family protein n=2 Tax=Halobacillus seohaensis TaxID=447421 RepID=A0ABW2EJ93_9BACI
MKVYNNYKITIQQVFMYVITLVFIFYSLSGYSGKMSNHISLALLCIWSLGCYIIRPKAFANIFNMKIVFVLSIYVIFLFCVTLTSPDVSYTFKLFLQAFVLFSPVFLFQYFKSIKNDRLFKYLLIASGCGWLFFTIRSIFFLSANPGAARLLATNATAYDNVLIGGGYSLAYGSAIIGVYLFDIYINKHVINKRLRVLILVIVILFAINIIKTESTITAISFFLGLMISIIYKGLGWTELKNIKTRFKQIFITTCLVFISLIVVYNYENIGSIINNLTSSQSSAIEIRLNEIGRSMEYGLKADYLESRFTKPFETLEVFFENPIIGVGYLVGFNELESKSLGVGNHSEWTDALAMMGITGGIPFLLIYYYGTKIERNYTKKIVSPAWIITMIIMGLFNPFQSFQSHFALFFLIGGIGYFISANSTTEKKRHYY